MTTLPTRRRPEGSTPHRRPMAAAARAAAKRVDRSGPTDDAAEVPGVEESAVHEEPAAAATVPRRHGILLPGLLLVALLAGLVSVTALGLQYRDAERTRKAEVAALAAAQKATPVILSYDYRHLGQDFAAASGFLTGPFRDQYAKTTETVVKPTALQYQGVVQATVAEPPGGGAPAASVVSASPDHVVVLLFVNQVTTSTRVSGPHLDLNRVRLTLDHTTAGWKVSAIDAI